MIRITINNTDLDLDPATAIPVNLLNPLFDRDGAERLFTFSFKLPATPRNLATLKHANRLDNHDNTTTYPGVTLYIEHAQFVTGGVLELDEQTFNAASINAIFTNESKTLLETLEKIDLHDILETVSCQLSPPDPYWTFSLTEVPATGLTYTIIIDTIAYSYTAPSAVPEEAVVASLRIAIEADHPGLVVPGTSETLRLYAEGVNEVFIDIDNLVRLELTSAVTVGESIHEGLRNHAIQANSDPSSHVFPVIYWPKYYNTLVDNYLERINPILDGEARPNLPSMDKLSWRAAWVPFVLVQYVLSRITNAAAGVFDTIEGWLADNPDAQDLIIFNNRSLDQVYYDRYSDPGLPFKYLNAGKTSIRLANHLPDFTAGEFISRLNAIFALWMRIEGTTVEFVKKRDQLAHPPIDWTQYAATEYTATRTRRRGYTLDLADITKEDQAFVSEIAPYPDQLAGRTGGEGFEDYDLPFNSAKVSPAVNVLGENGIEAGKLPYVQQTGSSDEGGIGNNNDFSFRLLFYRGLHPNADDLLYPYATYDATNYDGDPAGSLSLDLNDDDGLYDQHFKGIPELLADGTPVTMLLHLPIAKILELRTWQNSRRKISTPHGEIIAVVKSVQFRATMQGIGPCKVELVKQP